FDGQGIAQTEAHGPVKQETLRKRTLTAPMKIEQLDSGSVKVSVAGASQVIAVGAWSDWFKVPFRVGILKDISAIFKVYIQDSGTDFSMYMTSLQMDPLDPGSQLTHPKGYSKVLAESIGRYHTLG